MVEFKQAKQILDTLPISFYLKRKIKADLKDEDTSYCDIYNDEIVVGFKQFANANISESDAESDIRCLLYHEVSHALLTPTQLFGEVLRYHADSTRRIMNIFEDERIETICKNYYYGVNFKEFCKKLNRDSYGKIDSVDTFFYSIVRFDYGPKDLVNEKLDLVKTFTHLNKNSDYYDCDHYVDEILNFYHKVEKAFNQQQNNPQQGNQLQQSQQSQQISSSTLENDMTPSNSEEENETNETSTETDASNNIDEAQQSSDEDTHLAEVIGHAIEEFNKTMDSMHNPKMMAELSEIIHKKTTMNKQNGSAINAYSGVFDARSVARNDYKYFVKQNRLGNVKRFAKLKMNLFIDCSGSFYDSEKVVNQMLFNLSQLEKVDSDFSFDLIKMSTTASIAKKNDRHINCGGCNDIKHEIYDIYRKVSAVNSNNINIVLFDGDAFSGCDYKIKDDHKKNFGAFNHENCIIISDSYNEKCIRQYAPKAKTTILTGDYANNLIETVFKQLKQNI